MAVALLAAIELGGHLLYLVTHGGTPLWKMRTPTFRYVRFTPYGLLEYRPSTLAHMPGYPDSLATDRHGFIHNGEDRGIDGAACVVFMVGGSTVEGRGASSNRTTIPAQLEALLQQSLSAPPGTLRVLNAGFSGRASYQQLSTIEGRLLPEFDPDLIVALDGWNDGYYAVTYADHGWRPNWQPYVEELTRDVNRIGLEGDSFLQCVGVLQRRYSSLAALVERAQTGDPRRREHPQARPAPAELIARAARSYLDNQVMMHTRAALSGVAHASFLQPALLRSLKRRLSETENRALAAFAASYPDPAVFHPGMEAFYEAVSARSRDLPWFRDLSRLFEDEAETVYWDSIHYTDLGNRKIAEEIAAAVRPSVLAALRRGRTRGQASAP